MPTVLRFEGFRFFFYSNEGDPREAAHVHVERGGGAAKLWLMPSVSVADSIGFGRKDLSELIEIVETHRDRLERAWRDHFG